MGPRKYFIYSCAYDENGQENNPYDLGYSQLDFCNCLADDLIPAMTEREINYYIGENRHEEMMNNIVFSNIAQDCMRTAIDEWNQKPPPPEEVSIVPETRTSPIPGVIDSILVIVDYERKFYEIRDQQIEQVKQETVFSNEKLLSLKKKLNYEDIIQPKVIYNAYLDNSEEDNQAIYAYLRSLSPEELTQSSLLYNSHVVLYFQKIIAARLNEFLSE